MRMQGAGPSGTFMLYECDAKGCKMQERVALSGVGISGFGGGAAVAPGKWGALDAHPPLPDTTPNGKPNPSGHGTQCMILCPTHWKKLTEKLEAFGYEK